MCKQLKSVGLDVGTTTTQLVVSQLTVENRASAFAVPDMAITRRRILYKSPVYFTPLESGDRIRGDELRQILEKEYRSAGICRREVDTGAVIVTGETSRKENARRVLEALAEFAGDFVVATAGPDLESRLAAMGAGAVERSRETARPVLHMDIGGGTSNLALIREGKIERTGCLNVGGRLIKFDNNRIITYVSPVLRNLTELKVGDQAEEEALAKVARILAEALESAAGRRESPIAQWLYTEEASEKWASPREAVTVSFSGGVADCIEGKREWTAFGDLGVLLGRAIFQSSLCSGDYFLGKETIRATVIGAGCHSTQLSGSTVFCRNLELPLKNLPVVHIREPGEIPARTDGPCILAWPGIEAATYPQIREAARRFAADPPEPLLLCLEQDMAKALGQALALELPADAPILCIDGLRPEENSCMDIGCPVAESFPVVIKTLVLAEGT